ncbi:hypothetical protein MNBD_NITROSPINAE02-505 [hydrothermal vent metagenome]|uniref:Uncharacterized protein n=1 Tax=hydrothermal vent metagenome TaxID=652676 RepID=A0A3B1CWX6_9ZZZZ
MANLVADRKSIRKDGTLFSHPVAAAATLYAGALVNLDSTGYAIPAADDASHTFAGKADTRADNLAGADGDERVEGHREGVFEYSASGMTQSSVNDDAYVVDDNTIGLGITAQPTSVTGVTLKRTATSKGGTYALAYVSAGATLSWGGGAAVTVSSNGDYVLTAADGSQIMATVVSASLPASDATDASIALRHVRCGKIAEVVSATSVFIDILGAVRS